MEQRKKDKETGEPSEFIHLDEPSDEPARAPVSRPQPLGQSCLLFLAHDA